MRNSFSVKTVGLFVAALMIFGSFIFLTSASSEEVSNSQSINKLSADLEKMSAELTALKEAKSEAAVGIEPFIGEIALVGFNFAPRGWLKCEGQLLPISQYSALFSLLGTTYGGDGRTSFGLPDLRGRVPVGIGSGPGLSDSRWGEKSGTEKAYMRTTTAEVAPAGGRGNVRVLTGLPDQVNIKQPSLGMNYVIAITGIFPSRS